jgi:hypothetical protein
LTLSDAVTMMRALPVIKLGKLVLVSTRTEYLVSAVILWVAIWIATAATVDESAFDDMVPILGGGTVFFVVILPAALFRRPRQ